MPDWRLPATAMCLSVLGACSMAPAYQPPVLAAPAAYKEQGPWVPAAPGQANAPVPQWWTVFGDPVLDGLEGQVETGSPTVAAALGHYDVARAYLREAKSDALPHLGLTTDLTRNRQSDDRPLRGSNQPDLYGAYTLGGQVSYDADLWGRARDGLAARRAEVQASVDDLAALRISLQSQLASAYVALRGYDREIGLLETTVQAYTKADAMTQRRFSGGIADGVETGQSATQLAEAEAQLADLHKARALTEHAIAGFVGIVASDFTIASTAMELPVTSVPAGLPSTLLQRRPDVAAAERRMFAANRRIGVAKAAFYPALSLSATGGWQSTAIAGLASAPNVFWSLGPSAVLSLFDGGRNRARLAEARASWAEATASYRGTVLGAIQEVEDQLASVHYLADEADAETRAAQQAAQVERLSFNRYRKGAADYLDVVTAQTAALRAERASIRLHTSRLQATIGLIRAVGGGWTVTQNEAVRQQQSFSQPG